jgi:hypothetical protein
MIGNLYFKHPVLTLYKDGVIKTVTVLIDALRFKTYNMHLLQGVIINMNIEKTRRKLFVYKHEACIKNAI